MKFNKLLKTLLLVSCLATPVMADSKAPTKQEINEINQLKNKLNKMRQVDGDALEINDKFHKHKMAVSQAKMLKKIMAYEIYMFLHRHGTKRNFSDISKIVDVSWECSWIFTDLGDDHLARFKQILEWCKTETDFKAKTVSSWKKGQYIKSMNITITQDSVDYGPWQINDSNFEYVQGTYNLYRSGIVPFKIIKIKKLEDLFDIPTNCVARCVIETDRKSLGWEWRHRADRNKSYLAYMNKKIKQLESDGLYDSALVEKYYHLIPVKTYSAQR